MWRSKKFIVIGLIATVLLVGSIGGIALAQTEDGEDSQPGGILERVAAILVDDGVNITPEQLKDAFSQAQSDMRAEAMQTRLQNLVDQGKITQEEADEYQQWLQSKPDMSSGFGFKSWGGFRGGHRMHGFRAPALPTE